MNGLKKKVRELLGLGYPSEISVNSDDTFLVSYPKSGNTWLRFLVANSLKQSSGGIDFSNIEDVVPDIYVSSRSGLKKVQARRVIKSHESLTITYPKVVYLVRDPIDVYKSYYYFLNKRNAELSFDDYDELFFSGQLDDYGSWNQHVASWYQYSKAVDNVLIIKYEDLKYDTESLLTDILTFLEIDFDAGTVRNAVAQSSKDKMRELEKLTGKNWKPLKSSRDDISFVGHTEKRPFESARIDAAKAKILKQWRFLIEDLGYIENYK